MPELSRNVSGSARIDGSGELALPVAGILEVLELQRADLRAAGPQVDLADQVRLDIDQVHELGVAGQDRDLPLATAGEQLASRNAPSARPHPGGPNRSCAGPSRAAIVP